MLDPLHAAAVVLQVDETKLAIVEAIVDADRSLVPAKLATGAVELVAELNLFQAPNLRGRFRISPQVCDLSDINCTLFC